MSQGRKLTTKQRRFVEEYVGPANFNAADAARRAGYSERTAREIGYENLTKPHIADAVENRLEELSVSAAEVTKRLGDMSRASIADVISWNEGGLWALDLEKAHETGAIHMVKEISYDKSGRPKVKLHDPQRAAIEIAKIHGLYVERVEASLEVGGVLRVPGMDPEKWRQAAATNRVAEHSTNGHRNGSG